MSIISQQLSFQQAVILFLIQCPITPPHFRIRNSYDSILIFLWKYRDYEVNRLRLFFLSHRQLDTAEHFLALNQYEWFCKSCSRNQGQSKLVSSFLELCPKRVLCNQFSLTPQEGLHLKFRTPYKNDYHMVLCTKSSWEGWAREYHLDLFKMAFYFYTCKLNWSTRVKMTALQFFAKFKLHHMMHRDSEELISWPSQQRRSHTWSPCKARQSKSDPIRVFESTHTYW